ncbi:hypothetical protein Cfor_10825 [Coptotermes formosanus]|uniref:Sideroflexin 2 n=1 Tax=Coptotermes formosanus TaxID=36987 RepID=A0A6L2PKC3_COPFO|nr:hypothetical protein Cfor_10825 [Coptotermes formosanus]
MAAFPRFNVDKPLWDQSSFSGRLKHFFWVTDPRTCIVSEETLDSAKELVEQYRIDKEPPGTTWEQVVYAKKLYESAFHPDTGDKQNVFGRMSFQVPGGMAITGAMLQFYRCLKTTTLEWLEPEMYQKLRESCAGREVPRYVYFNKGL